MNKTATEVNLASQTHQVPHIGFPHIDPLMIHINVKTAPIGATDVFTIKPKGVLNARALILYTTIIKHVISDNQALGT